MDLREYMKKMNAETTFSKQTNDMPVDKPRKEEPVYDPPATEERDNDAFYSPVLKQLKSDFAKAFRQIQIMTPRVVDMPTPTDEGVELKRRGEYIKSSRIYADYIQENNVLTPMLAQSWFKTLASGGDTEDALKIADYLESRNPPDCYATNMLRQHREGLRQLIRSPDKKALLDYLGKISGNPRRWLSSLL